MPRKWPRHFLVKPSGFYFQATPAMKRAGISSEPLGREMTAAIARAEALNAAWDEIRQGLEPVKLSARRGTFSHLVEQLRQSSEWSDKGARTIEELEFAIKELEPIFGAYDLKQITPEACRSFYDALRAKGSVHRSKKVMKWFRYLFNFGLRYQLAITNPTLAVRIKTPPAREVVWNKEQIAAVVNRAREAGRPCVALAVQIGHATALRESDVLALTWSQFDGERLVVKQGKTGRRLSCPLTPETVAMIKNCRKGTVPLPSAPIVRAPHGRRYTLHNFSHKFREICRDAGVPDELKFQDLRRTTATELAAAGATAAEIAAVTGHSIVRGQQILDTYIKTNEQMARNAQAKRNKGGPEV
jgi:integrase